jgi:DNA-binding response OmpR family regulator
VQETRKILVVDANEHFRELESFLLARKGHVMTARDSREALELALRDRPDVVVAAVQLGGTSGDALCKDLKSQPTLARVPVILVSGNDSGADRERAVRAGADDFLTRPIDQLTFLRAVSRFLRTPIVRGPPRATCNVPVSVRIGDEEIEARSCNISRAGMHVEIDHELEAGSEVRLHFEMPESRSATSATARVVWKSEDDESDLCGVGLRFLVLDRESAQHIEAYGNERIPTLRAPAFRLD